MGPPKFETNDGGQQGSHRIGGDGAEEVLGHRDAGLRRASMLHAYIHSCMLCKRPEASSMTATLQTPFIPASCAHLQAPSNRGRTAHVSSAIRARKQAHACNLLSKRVPAQVALLHKLLHVLGCGASRTSLEKAAASKKGHNRKHLGAVAVARNVCQRGTVSMLRSNHARSF
jgi:hypothetical protein